jgi:hypothetical protein
VESDATLRRDGLGRAQLVDGLDDPGNLLTAFVLLASDILDSL